MTALIALICLVVAMVAGIPIPLSFFFSAAIICFITGTNPLMLLGFGFNNQNTILLLTIPLFVMAGAIIDKGGLGEKLIEGIQRFGKSSRVTLGTVTIVACALFGAVSGSASATTSCIGSIMTPRLKENGYTAGHIGGLLSSSGVLGIMIPPSILMILYAWGTGTSVLACFLSTVIPGIILVVLFSIVNMCLLKYYDKKGGASPAVDKALDNMINEAQHKEAVKKIEEVSGGKKKKGGESIIPAVLMPVVMLGSIYSGILTTTESAALSVFYSLVVGAFYYRKVDFKVFKNALATSGETAGTIMIMLFTVSILSRLYMTENLPDLILTALTSISENRIVLLLMLNVFMIIIGMLMDDCSGTTLCGPILMPVMMALGVTPVHFAAILSVNIGMGNVTPPTAPLLYLGGRVADAEVKDMLMPTFALIGFGWLPTLALTTFIPQLSLFLPTLFGFA